MSTITTRTLACGATLVHEHVQGAQSVAVRVMVPVGTAADAPDSDGVSVLLSEYVFRGAGGLDSRELSDALDRHGVDRSVRPGAYRMLFGATMLADAFEGGTELITSMIRRPEFPTDALEPVRSLALQALDSLEDDPQHLVMLRLGEKARPEPFHRHGYGDADVIGRLDAETLRAAWTERCRPGGTIVSVAGGVDVDQVAAGFDRWFDGWEGSTPDPTETAPAVGGAHAIEQETAQVHIGLAWSAPPAPHADAVLERVAMMVLSGSTSGRLFSEVRQKRSLCYSVGASYAAGRDRGMVSMYAGTTPERAQETLDVSMAEINRMREGVTREEFDRALLGVRSRLVMQGESTPARASSLASDQFRLGRPRSLEEQLAEFDAVSHERLQAYLADRVAGPFTLVTIGPKPLDLPS